jgi:hypothetical protein
VVADVGAEHVLGAAVEDLQAAVPALGDVAAWPESIQPLPSMWKFWMPREIANACSSDRSDEFPPAVWCTTMNAGTRSSTSMVPFGGRAPHSAVPCMVGRGAALLCCSPAAPAVIGIEAPRAPTAVTVNPPRIKARRDTAISISLDKGALGPDR